MAINQPNTVPFPRQILTVMMAEMTEAEYKCISYIVLHTFGYHNRRIDSISLAQFCHGITVKVRNGQGSIVGEREVDKGTGLSRSSVIAALKKLEAKGIIFRLDRETDSGATGVSAWGLVITEEAEDGLEASGLVDWSEQGVAPPRYTRRQPAATRVQNVHPPGAELHLSGVQNVHGGQAKSAPTINNVAANNVAANNVHSAREAAPVTPVTPRVPPALPALRARALPWMDDAMERVRAGIRYQTIPPAMELELRRAFDPERGELAALGDLTETERANWWAFAFSNDYLERNAHQLVRYMAQDLTIWLGKGTHTRVKSNGHAASQRPAAAGSGAGRGGKSRVGPSPIPHYDPARDGLSAHTRAVLTEEDYVYDDCEGETP